MARRSARPFRCGIACLKQPRGFVQDHAYWGCESTADECAAALREVGLPFETLTSQRCGIESLI